MQPPSVDPLANLRRLTPRDRLLLSWLAEHYVLTTEQITAALFPSRRWAQKRLTLLHRIDTVSRFAFARTETDTGSYRYTLGPLGVRLHPTTWTDPDNPTARPPRSHLERRDRIARSPRLAHLLGVNQFFTDLHAHARSRPPARLERWWSEQHATYAYAASGIRPDGHGVWRVGDTTIGFFLEHDNETEDLPRVIGKLRAYQRLAEFGPRYPVLLWVPNRRRETNLQRALAGVPTAMPIATAVHAPDPASRIWALAGDTGPRHALHELPSDHGPAAATNPNRYRDDEIVD